LTRSSQHQGWLMSWGTSSQQRAERRRSWSRSRGSCCDYQVSLCTITKHFRTSACCREVLPRNFVCAQDHLEDLIARRKGRRHVSSRLQLLGWSHDESHKTAIVRLHRKLLQESSTYPAQSPDHDSVFTDALSANPPISMTHP
jgi:hypothetical protein